MSRMRIVALQLAVLIGGLVAWHVLTTVTVGEEPLMDQFFFSTPLDAIARTWRDFSSGVIWCHLWITLLETLLAFVIGAVGGIVIGFWFARWTLISAVFAPYVKLANGLPRVVLAPIFALWFGLGI